MAAVERLVLAGTESPHVGKMVIGETDPECPKCHKSEYVRNGRDRCKSGERQRYLCKGCGRRFRDNLGFERRHVSPMYITLALLLNGMGLSPANIQVTLGHLGVTAHVDTVTRWLECYAGLVEGVPTPYGHRPWERLARVYWFATARTQKRAEEQ